MNPTIATPAIATPQSVLALPAGDMLSTVLGATLSAGTLAMSGGLLSSPSTLISGGLLIGKGTIVVCGGNTGGTVMPVGTRAILGSYTQTGAALAYLPSPKAASPSTAPRRSMYSGRHGDTGALYTLSTQYEVLTASFGVEGRFAQISSSLPSIFLRLKNPVYNPTSVDLSVDRTPFDGGERERQSARRVPIDQRVPNADDRSVRQRWWLRTQRSPWRARRVGRPAASGRRKSSPESRRRSFRNRRAKRHHIRRRH